MKIGELLKIEDLKQINIESVKAKHREVFNVPNSQWEKSKGLEFDLEALNSTETPYIVKLYLLNHLPYSIIRILQEIKAL